MIDSIESPILLNDLLKWRTFDHSFLSLFRKEVKFLSKWFLQHKDLQMDEIVTLTERSFGDNKFLLDNLDKQQRATFFKQTSRLINF